MPAYKKQVKKMTMNKDRLNPGGKLIEGAKCVGSLCGELALGTLKTIEKNMKTEKSEKSNYKFISGIINDIIKCLEMEPDILKTFLKEQIDIDDDYLDRIMSLATTKNIIKNRFDECFKKSIVKDHKKLEKFLNKNKISKKSDLLHIITILQLLLDKLKLDEVDRIDLDFDDNEKRFFYVIMVQFIDPCSVLMGISMCDEDARFDFFKEWMTYIYPTIDPDIEISQDGGYKKTKKKKKSNKKKKSRKKKKSSKKKSNKKSKRKNKIRKR